MHFPLAVLLVACPDSVVPAYDQARAEALADPGLAPDRWSPDLVLHLSGPVIEDVARIAIAADGGLNQRVEQQILGQTVSITPDLTVQRVRVAASDACPSCLAIDTTVSGTARWAALGERGEVDLRVRGQIDVKVDSVGQDGLFAVKVTPRDVGELTVTVSGANARVGDVIEQLASDELRKKILAGLPPIDLGMYGSTEAPLRGLRAVGVEGGGVQLEMLSSSPSPGKVAVRDRALAEGFALYADLDSVLDMARAAAFRQPPLTHGIVVEPTALAIEGKAFELGVRLWRPVGRGWWRDYAVSGTLGVGERQKRVVLDAKSVVEGAKSDGAELADPLVTLGEGVILSSIGDSVHANLPAKSRAVSAGVRVDTALTSVSGEGGMLVAIGTVAASGIEGTRTRPK